jgi:drug/metabolite transporter (DMT)-like permease
VARSAPPRIALLALIWGSAFLWIKLADRGFSPVEVTLARLAMGAAVLFAVVLARRETVPRSLRLWAHIAVAALFANAVPYLLFAVAEQSVNSSTAGVINATTPLWTVVLALAVRHQKTLTNWQAGGMIVGFAGAVLIFSPWRMASGLTSAGGLECLAASISYAVSYIYMDRFLARRGLSAIVLSACQLTAAAVMLAVALAVSGAPAPRITAESVTAIAVLGIIGTGFAYVLNYQIITSEGATVASTVTYLLPVFAIVLGVLALNESVTVTVLAGIALVLAGVGLTRHHAKPAVDEPRLRTGQLSNAWPDSIWRDRTAGGGGWPVTTFFTGSRARLRHAKRRASGPDARRGREVIE